MRVHAKETLGRYTAKMLRIVCLVLSAALAEGAVVKGRVSDVRGAGVPGAMVELVSAAQVTVARTVSGEDGRFQLPEVAPGAYSARGTKEGFATRALAVGGGERDPEEIELVLAPAPLTQAVTVTAQRGAVEDPVATETASVTRVREAQMPAATVGEWLSGAPGILVQQTAPSQVSPFLRGLTGYQVLNLVDGVRYNNSTFRSGPNQYLAYLEPSQVQRMEATLGPGSAQYGSDALGGTIQVLTAESRFASGREAEWHGDVTLFGATADLSGGAEARLSAAGERWFWLAGLSGRRHQDLRAGGGTDSRHTLRRLFGAEDGVIDSITGTRQQDTGFAQYGFHGKAAFRLSERQILSGWYQRGRQEMARNYKDLWGGLGRMESGMTPQGLDLGYVRWEMVGWRGFESISGTFSVNSQLDGTVRQNLRATDTRVRDEGRVDAYGGSGQAVARAGARHWLVFGGEWYDEQIQSARTETNPVTGAVRNPRPLYPDGSRYRTAAVFGQDRWEVIPNRLRVTGGGRFTAVRYANPAEPRFGTPAGEQTFRDGTFHVSALYQIHPAFGVHALVGRGFRAPNTNDLGALGLNDLGYEIPASSAGNALLGSNAGEGAVSLGREVGSLRAEHLLNTEFGVRWNTRRLRGRAQAFLSTLEDPIVRRTLLYAAGSVPGTLAGLAVRPLPPTAAQAAQGVVTVATELDPRAVKAFVNDGRTRYSGIEAWTEWTPARRWVAEFGYSFLAGRDMDPNRPVRRLPPQQGTARVRYLATRWWVETGIVATGAQSLLSGGDLDDERIGASRSRNDIASFFAGARIAPWIDAQGRFTPTGETLRQIQDRVLPGVADSLRVPLYRSTAGWWTWNAAAGAPLGERWHLLAGVSNVLDRNYRVHGSGADSGGVNAWLSLSYRF